MDIAAGGGLAAFAATFMTGFPGATPIAPVWAQEKAAPRMDAEGTPRP
jgi:hypothetical protein